MSEIDRFDVTGREAERLKREHRREIRDGQLGHTASGALADREDLTYEEDDEDAIFDPRTGRRIDLES